MTSPEHLDLAPLIGAAGSVRLPGSKSISNRVLLLAALAAGPTRIAGLLDSDDTRVMLAALGKLGVAVSHEADGTTLVQGCGGRFPAPHADLFMGNAGTAIRPLTAALALMGGSYTLHGVPRMHERPIGDLVDALRGIGCEVASTGRAGYPPLAIGPGAPRLGAPLRVRGDVSSQFLTALLLALPLLTRQSAVEIEVVGTLISRPYIDITLRLLARFGIHVVNHDWQRFVIPAGSAYASPGRIAVEGDASSASYFLAAGVLGARHGRGDAVRVEGVDADSIQGDVEFARVLERLGAAIEWGDGCIAARGLRAGRTQLAGGAIDCLAIPDAAMTLAVTALFASEPTLLTGIGSWRVKETDRIAAMAAELAKLGATVESGPDWLRVHPLPDAHWRGATIATYDDHRMAMCFSLASFGPADIRIADPGCVSKTFPDYFAAFAQIARPVPVIAIDGPTASGKGTVAARVAAALRFHYLDSGALYRATALLALRQGVARDDARALAELARHLPIRCDDAGAIWLGAENVSQELRAESVGQAASAIAALPALRNALLDLQHALRRPPGLVADGRDMGTVVFAQAPLKVFLTANAAARADRRHKQLISQGISATFANVLRELEARDARDMQRSVAALKPAPDALLLDTSELDVDQTVHQVLQWWSHRS
jgi:3-phosphoshikimate 1-carboxyvinyltransferase